MKHFLDDNFLLDTKTAEQLYHEYAKKMPIIDYHCHLPPQQIAEDARFKNITQAWLYGDHYKWRAMRTNGINEAFITGSASDEEKFLKWAETVPYTMRNPLYHWTHLELQRYFDVQEALDGSNGARIYETTSSKISSPDYSVRSLLRKMNVKVVCTTDDPVDSLEFHKTIKADGFEIPVLPAFRPDNAMNVSSPETFAAYVARLEAASDTEIKNLDTFLQALKSRHDFFAEMGCSVSDHGLEYIQAADYTEAAVRVLFDKILKGTALSPEEQEQFRSAMLVWFAEWDHEKGWVQQYHLGALRNNNTRLLEKLGPDTGWDSIGDFTQGRSLSKFLNGLDKNDRLAKTILYNLNPSDNELFATMTGNFNDGTVAGKVQWGSGWWFLDQKDGMIDQMNTLSNMGLISRFVGMLTDSRSFLSFPRHEYFRRILCNLFGNDIENGELPADINWIGKIIEDICFNNANAYFGFNVK
ncbi:glucuronate isomerase [Niabella beijingensis]|uniref:glucuronate isomerase n=1 Tax=Niabella beijingensis TaxID=2872700 RepID=UPI001CBBA523|nr:glucuronate isomerase [Niabella beijingensis]MBZ4190229.1 glucuronate isomerase [Niabella beijingensis]